MNFRLCAVDLLGGGLIILTPFVLSKSTGADVEFNVKRKMGFAVVDALR